MNGILLVDKPTGCTSHDVVWQLKKIVRPAKVGHTGTLDPAASGLLIIAIGAATRAIQFLDDARKTYEMTIRLGEETDTWDREGTVISEADTSHLSLEDIHQALSKYSGVVRQTPPHFSALKKNGTPLYKLARKGVFPELEPREVEISALELLSWANPFLEVRMTCSRGAYARSVAHDIGKDLGVGGRLERLRRTGSGPYDVQDAVSMDDVAARGKAIAAEKLIPLRQALAHIPTLSLTPPEIARLMNGSTVLRQKSELDPAHERHERSGSLVKVFTSIHDALIIAVIEERDGMAIIRPKKILATAVRP
ncbi:MAG: tRNA pseudouridine(55) synthase TruB [Desulfomonilaceae bacterium]